MPRFFRLIGLIALCLTATAGLVVGWSWWGGRRSQTAFEQGLAAAAAQDLEGLSTAQAALEGNTSYEPHWHLLRGLSLRQRGELGDALSELGQAVGHSDTTAQALLVSGQIFMDGGDHVNAVRMLNGALEADPALVDAHRYLIATYYDTGAMENVLQHIDHVTRLDPTDARPWRLRGLILKDFERFDEAVPAYDKALELKPSPQVVAEIRQELAESLVQLKQFERAIEQLNLLSVSSEQQAVLAEAQLALGNESAAEQALAKAEELEPTNRRALQTRGSLLLEQGNIQAAADLLQRGVELHPLEVDLRASLMLAYQRLGAKEQAELQQQELGRIRQLQDKFNRLHIDSINNPTDVNSRVELARTAIELRKYDAAVSWYQAALSMDPNHAAAQFELSQLTSQLSQLGANPSK